MPREVSFPMETGSDPGGFESERLTQVKTFATELPASALSPLRTWPTGQGRLWPVGSCHVRTQGL